MIIPLNAWIVEIFRYREEPYWDGRNNRIMERSDQRHHGGTEEQQIVGQISPESMLSMGDHTTWSPNIISVSWQES
jgi:hypothetical protein